MSSPSKKDIKNKKDKSNKPENKSNQKNISSQEKSTDLKPFNTSDSSFLLTMEQLVSNDKSVRESAALKTKKFLHQSYTNNEELYQKISRSLFYFYWNTDKSSYQLSMAKLIASFIDSLGAPPLCFNALVVAVRTIQSGFSSANLHLIFINFSPFIRAVYIIN